MTTVPVAVRIGIWCAYGETLVASDGIGVFVHQLARGLAGLDEPRA